MLNVRRRQFLTLLGGAVAAWPLAARAQQPGVRVYRIEILGVTSLRAAEGLVNAFRDGMRERCAAFLSEKAHFPSPLDPGMLSCPAADANRGGATWIGPIIFGTKRPSIGNLLKRPKIYLQSKSFSTWQRFVRKQPITSRIVCRADNLATRRGGTLAF